MSLESAIQAKGISRVCHFTPSRNLLHIMRGGVGILATKRLEESEREILNATDLERLDGYPDHVCCSIQFPNAWYFKNARGKDILFRDWVVLILSKDVLLESGVKFCKRNAAAGRGRYVREGIDGFNELYEQTVVGASVYTRTAQRPASMPTDDQAEVLIPDHVPLDRVVGIAVADLDQAKREMLRLRMSGVTQFPQFYVAPIFFDAASLSWALKTGTVPVEVPVNADILQATDGEPTDGEPTDGEPTDGEP